MLSDKAVEAIQASELTTTIEVGADEYLTRPVFAPPPEPRADTLTVATLDGFIEFVNSDINVGRFNNGIAIHVESPTSVALVSGLYGRARQREEYYRATLVHTPFSFGRWHGNEEFIISLQCQFVQTDQRDRILSLVGGIQKNVVATWEDDGTTQAVTAKAGVSLVKEMKVPNPVELCPLRTFMEVAQPSSLFVLRVREGKELPECALFEADGGAWKLEAAESIAAYLKGKVPEGITISA